MEVGDSNQTNETGVRDAAADDLMVAASRGDYSAAARLVTERDVNVRDQFGNTALLYAAGAGHAEVVRLLLKAGADPSAKSRAGATALERALAGGHHVTEWLLLRAEKERQDHQQQVSEAPLADADRSLLAAVEDRDVSAAKLALLRGADPSACAPGGSDWSALIIAAAHGDELMVGLLLSRGANPDAPARDGRRAVHFAAALADVEIVRLLAAAGAQLDAKDVYGKTALETAAGEGCEPIVAELLRLKAEA